MSCPNNSEIGNDGKCYRNCPAGYTALNNGPFCALNCPQGYAPSGLVDGALPTCLRPSFQREIKPVIFCPTGSDRHFDKCYLACPSGTSAKYDLCIPDCPKGFVESKDKQSCQAEFIKRIATVREACYANETRVGGRICLGPCDVGTVPYADNSEMCYSVIPTNLRQYFWTGDKSFSSDIGPVVSKLIFARTVVPATCGTDFTSLHGQCYAKCPTGSKAVGTECLADCSAPFKTSANQTACIRPVITRPVVVSIWNTIGSIFVKLFVGILIILLFSVIAAKLFQRRQ